MFDVNKIVEPAHTGELLPAVGVAGAVFTTTVVVAIALVQPPTVTVKLYVPAIPAVADGRVGSSKAEVNALGPVQLYVAPATVFDVNKIVEPTQTGELLPAVGVAGAVFTTTVVVAIALVQPPTVTVKLYVPAIPAVADGRVGSSKAEVNALGPVQLYVAPATVFDVNNIVDPTQTGELLPAVGVDGKAFTTTDVVATKLVHPPTVTVKL